jgi:hypothetical protein
MKNNKVLRRELVKNICSNIGASPLFIDKNVSLTSDHCLQDKGIKIEGFEKEIEVWCGAVGTIQCMVSVIEDEIEEDDGPRDEFEVTFMLRVKNAFGEDDKKKTRVIGIRFDWFDEDDVGLVVSKLGDKWVEISLSELLVLASGIEDIVYEGIVWEAAAGEPDYEEFSSLLLLTEQGEGDTTSL